ncbi:MAG: tripartite tricarboxylate transporter TctB family protein, partial [Pseudomonadota bacterium]
GGGLIGFLALIHVIGFYGAMLVFLIYYLYFLGRHSITQTLAISIGTPIFSFFFFDVAMRIVLPKGYLEPLFIPLYDMFL